MQAIHESVQKALAGYLKDEYEAKKKELIADMDKRFYNELASIALKLTNLCDFAMMQDRLVITVHRKDPKVRNDAS